MTNLECLKLAFQADNLQFFSICHEKMLVVKMISVCIFQNSFIFQYTQTATRPHQRHYHLDKILLLVPEFGQSTLGHRTPCSRLQDCHTPQ